MACTRCGWDCATSTGISNRDNCDVSSNSRSQRRGSTLGVMEGLKVHVGIGCGRVSCFHVGSDKNGWQLVVSGDVFEAQVMLMWVTCLPFVSRLNKPFECLIAL